MDATLIDIGLAGSMSGIELAQKINEISSAAVVFVTGNSWAKDDEKLKSTKFEDIIIKPVLRADIKAAISKYVAGK